MRKKAVFCNFLILCYFSKLKYNTSTEKKWGMNGMKKIILLCLMLASMAMLVAGCGGSDTAKKDAGQKIVIGLDDSFPPMGFRDEKNEIVGFDIDMAKEAAKRLGMEVEFKAIDWSSKESELNGKRVDCLWNGMNITEDRKKNVLFSDPYMDARQIIFVPNGSSIKSVEDLSGKVIGIQNASTADEKMMERGLEANYKELRKYGDFMEAFMDLQAGRLDAIVGDEIVGRFYLSKNPQAFKALDVDFCECGVFGIAFRKDDTELRNKVQAVMDEMKKDGSGAEISTKWFGKNLLK